MLPCAASKPVLAVLTADEPFWENLLSAASSSGLRLIRPLNLKDGLHAPGLFESGAVLVDLDIPTLAIWEMADRLLEAANAPPMLLLTSRGDRVDLLAAVDAGLIDKRAKPAEVLAAAERSLNPTDCVSHQRKAKRHIAVRWLQPGAPTFHRYWGINE